MNKNQFALTPPMGWNSFDYYDTTVTEAQVKANADYMAAHLKAYGWEYIVVDIEWFAHRAGSMRDQYQYIPFNDLEMDAYGRLLPDPERFPSSVNGAGFKPLADYVHALGLKFGIHIMRGIPRAAAHSHLPIYGLEQTAGDDCRESEFQEISAAGAAKLDFQAASGTGAKPDYQTASGTGAKPDLQTASGTVAKPDLQAVSGTGAKPDYQTISGTCVTAADVADPYSISRWNPDMYGLRADRKESQVYYDSIFELYAQWGVDYVKCDDICNTNAYPHNPYSAAHEIEMIHAAIQKCGRPIVLSLSPGPALIEHAWHYEKYANMWRITDDFWDEWPLLLNMFERCELWQNHVSRGCFPDCDMLPLGSLGKGFGHEWQTRFTKAEQVTMMTLWCMFRSPLMLGAELTKLDDWTLSLLTNREVLSLLEDGRHGAQVQRTKEYAVWVSYCDGSADSGPSAAGGVQEDCESCAGSGSEPGCADAPVKKQETFEKNENFRCLYLALFNLTDAEREISVSLEEIAESIPEKAGCGLQGRKPGTEFAESSTEKQAENQTKNQTEKHTGKSFGRLYEVWSGAETERDGEMIAAQVEAHGAKLFRVF
ncbi:MAG: glycoside hydrolase family 27 protein [Lachnospiraceae bacterium]|nr:glycoside hydrolase family 27 protein [Lachnospiraceae bacterium]